MVLVRVEHANAVAAANRAGEMRDVFGYGVLAANASGVDAVTFTGLAHGIVTAVEVLALFKVLGEVIAPAGELSVESEEALLLGGEGLLGKDTSAGLRLVTRRATASQRARLTLMSTLFFWRGFMIAAREIEST